MAKQSRPQKKTVERVMHEYKHGELESGGRRKVKNPKQAIAIALSEAGASKKQSPAENRRRLQRTKSREAKGETGEATREGRGTAAARGRGGARRTTSAARRTTQRAATGQGGAATRRSATRPAATKRKASTRTTPARGTTTRKTAARGRPSTTRRGAAAQRSSSRPAAARAGTARRTAGRGAGMTKAQLYNEAKRRKVPGRSRMSKGELAKAVGGS